jgi:alpha-glucosidase
MLALPGSAYLYQGEELGLPEVIDLPDEARQDPTWFRTNGERYGRDGCRVPLPWKAQAPAYGFNDTGLSWLPQPAQWAHLAREVQQGNAASTLSLYETLLAERRARGLGAGTLEWVESGSPDVLVFRNTSAGSAGTGSLTVVANVGSEPVPLPTGTVIASSEPLSGSILPPDTTAWIAD